MKKFILTILFHFIAISLCFAQNENQYLIGFGKADITFAPKDLGLFGFGVYDQRLEKEGDFTSKIYSRVISIKEPESGKQIFLLHADLGAIFMPLRRGLVRKIRALLIPDFDDAALMMTASHTHCAASGMSDYPLYMMSAPGYNPELIEFTVDGMYESIEQAFNAQTKMTIELKEGFFEPEIPVAFNRALKSHNKNPEIQTKFKRNETHLALNRNMPLLSFKDQNGNNRGFINWFGVHPIEMLGDHNFIDGASKGYAASFAEDKMKENDIAIFAQSSAGDVMTTDLHNPKSFEKEMQTILDDPHYDCHKSSLKQAKWNGKIQAEKALKIQALNEGITVQGEIDFELIYVDLTNVKVDKKYANGFEDAKTTSPCWGAPFLSGSFSWHDGNFNRLLLSSFALVNKSVFYLRSPFLKSETRLKRKALYQSQEPKKIVINGSEKSTFGLKYENYTKKVFPRFFYDSIASMDPSIKEVTRQLKLEALNEHSILPEILPIQIVRIGNIAIAGIPTEITTIAYNRLQKTILDVLKTDGIDEVFISSYANEYAGYTTTIEEYVEQRYEAGHTLYGKHQLGAFQTEFTKLALEFCKTKKERNLNYEIQPPIFSAKELGRRSNLEPLK